MGYYLTFFAGLIILFISILFLGKSVRFQDNGIRTTGKVVEIFVNEDSDGDTYSPVFEFTDIQQRVIRYKYYVSSSPAAWDLGDEATLVYNPDNPKEVKICTYYGLYGTAVTLIAIAMPFLVIGGGYIMYTYRNR
ncbi:hypothetical protein D3C71_128560 [compost metagenome]